ncbi:MAG: AbrB/MazE/SpoVT family DNA-binding domain-containing protein [Candidatus Woesearchaeota archaeon]
MDIAITRISSKGQIVIPSEMRHDLKEGDKLLIIKNDGQLILRKATDMKLAEDLEFAKRTEEAAKRFDKGLFKEMSLQEFKKELEKW